MNVANRIRHPAALAVVLVAAAATAVTAQQPAATTATPATRTELRWTPHRAAVASAGGGATAAPVQPADSGVAQVPTAPTATATGPQAVVATAAPAAGSPTTTQTAPAAPRIAQAPPATVGLPEGVPAVVPPRASVARRPSAPRGQRLDDWQSPNRIPGPFRETAGIGGLRLPEIDQVFRAPQGDGGRPLLAVEGTPRAVPRGPVARRQADGGLAPRFNPNAGRGPARGDRLAMNNVDALPSVMTRQPQAAAVEGNPPRTPAAMPAPTQTLPAPTATSPEPPIVIETMPGTREYVGGETIVEGALPEGYFPQGGGPEMGMEDGDGGMWMGNYPTQLHVESFYDDPFACEEGDGCLPLIQHDGRICAWLRQFGRPYYGWRWYRDFTASAGVTAFENQADLGLRGNFGFNEYLNWAMPFWNAFGIGWQVGVRGVQTNFSGSHYNHATYGSLSAPVRDQVFLTTGFFTRAFEGRGLQGGAVWDYLSDRYYSTVDVAQIRGELSYVWGYHEIGFWGAFNVREQPGFFSPALGTPGMHGTIDLYTAFYRLHFGDANEARIWGGASGDGQGVIGSSIRAPMSRSWALEGTFTYLMPAASQGVPLTPDTGVSHTPQAWNLGVNLV